MTDDTDKLLMERGKTHGDYTQHARLTRETLSVWQSGRNWNRLSDTQLETLHMIAHKVGRILEGDPDYADHWLDIAGYSRLVSQRLAPASGGMVPVHAVGDPEPVPVEDSNRHADRATGNPLKAGINMYEYSVLDYADQKRYWWDDGRSEWRLKSSR